jgi:hypothetical protein
MLLCLSILLLLQNRPSLEDTKNQNVPVLIRQRVLLSRVLLNLVMHHHSMVDSKEFLLIQNLCEEDIINLNLGRQALDEQEESPLHRKDQSILQLLHV